MEVTLDGVDLAAISDVGAWVRSGLCDRTTACRPSRSRPRAAGRQAVCESLGVGFGVSVGRKDGLRPWAWAWRGYEESAAVGWGVGVEVIAHPVDDDVVVKPAEGGEVVGLCSSALRERDDVVGLESVVAGAAVDHTPLVSPKNESSESRWDSC